MTREQVINIVSLFLLPAGMFRSLSDFDLTGFDTSYQVS